jgi:hypothetical protein
VKRVSWGVVDFRINAVMYQHTDVDLAQLGRALGVLAQYERLER